MRDIKAGGLLLEDGTWFEGKVVGEFSDPAEVVFNTSMTGYQEVITDPSYCNQMIVMTYPLIGNYGVREDESEGVSIKCKGLICKEITDFTPSHESLSSFLANQKIPTLFDVDTRAIVKKMRDQGTMKGMILTATMNKDEALVKIKEANLSGAVKACSVKKEEVFEGDKFHIVLYDFGYKKSIKNSLLMRQAKVTIVPYDTSFERVKEINPDGVVLSNGPGDPKELTSFLPEILKLQKNFPLLGICLGHQLFALANGLETGKMHFGHRGGNHAVKDLEKDKCFLTSQNHGYEVISSGTDHSDMIVTHINVNDKSIEGLRHKNLQAISVQFHPEANPGPTDSGYIFDDFLTMINKA